MMKRLLAFVVALSSLNLCFVQLQIVDMARVKVDYRYTFYPDSNRTTGVITSDMVLLVGNTISRFTQAARVPCDSLLYYYPEDKTIFQKMNDFYNSYNSHSLSSSRTFPRPAMFTFYKHGVVSVGLQFLIAKG